MYYSSPLYSLQYVDELLTQLEVSRTAKLHLQPKKNIGKKIRQFGHLYYLIVFKAWIFFRRAARKNVTTLKDVVQL
jgi:hypothetical protein